MALSLGDDHPNHHPPSDVALITIGPLTVKTSQEVAVFGALRLSNGAEISTPAKIDLCTSAWLHRSGHGESLIQIDNRG